MQILHVCIQLLPGKNPESRNKAISANPHDLFLSLRDRRFSSAAPVSRAVVGISGFQEFLGISHRLHLFSHI